MPADFVGVELCLGAAEDDLVEKSAATGLLESRGQDIDLRITNLRIGQLECVSSAGAIPVGVLVGDALERADPGIEQARPSRIG